MNPDSMLLLLSAGAICIAIVSVVALLTKDE